MNTIDLITILSILNYYKKSNYTLKNYEKIITIKNH